MNKRIHISFVLLLGFAVFLNAHPSATPQPEGSPEYRPVVPPNARVIPAQSKPTDAERRRLYRKDPPPHNGSPSQMNPPYTPGMPPRNPPGNHGPGNHGPGNHSGSGNGFGQGRPLLPPPPPPPGPPHFQPPPPPPPPLPPGSWDTRRNRPPQIPKPQIRSTPKGWFDDYDAALVEAEVSQRPILVLFTGSDWCPWCIKLHKEVLDHSTFRNYAKQELILVYVDSPSGFNLPPKVKQQHARLEKELGAGGGVPCTILVSPEGVKLGEISGYRKENEYMKELRKILKRKGFPRRNHR